MQYLINISESLLSKKISINNHKTIMNIKFIECPKFTRHEFTRTN